MTKLIAAFRNFAKHLKSFLFILRCRFNSPFYDRQFFVVSRSALPGQLFSDNQRFSSETLSGLQLKKQCMLRVFENLSVYGFDRW